MAPPARRAGPAVGAPVGWALAAVPALVVVCGPVLALLVRAPWRHLAGVWRDAGAWTALRLSAQTATAATVLAVAAGLPLAVLLARLPGRAADVLRALVTLPVVLPPVVGGVALLSAVGRRGLLGPALHRGTGLTLPFHTAGVVLAECFVSLPFFVLTVEGALRGLDPAAEEAAATLGAGPLQVLVRVTLPRLQAALGAGAVLCWARAVGEFGATVTFAGSLPGVTRTLPLAVYVSLETDPGAAVAVSLLLIAVAVLVLVGLRSRWWPRRRPPSRDTAAELPPLFAGARS